MLVILIPLVLEESPLVLPLVLDQVLGKNISLTLITLSVLSVLSNKKSILTVQSKPVSLSMLISWVTNLVFIFTLQVQSKEDMLSKLLVGDLPGLKTIGLLLTLGDPVGVFLDISGAEWANPNLTSKDKVLPVLEEVCDENLFSLLFYIKFSIYLYYIIKK